MKKWRKNNDKYLKYQRDYQRKYIKAWRKKYFKLNPEKEQEYRENARRSSRNFWLRKKAEKCKCGNTVKQDDYVCISGDKIVKCPKCDENQP